MWKVTLYLYLFVRINTFKISTKDEKILSEIAFLKLLSINPQRPISGINGIFQNTNGLKKLKLVQEVCVCHPWWHLQE